MKIPSIVIAGTNSGCGKTTVAMGIMAALTDKGLKVQPFKVGPDYIDPMFHTFITGRESRNLDSWMLSEETVRCLFSKNLKDADIAVIEGVMGLYDGYGGRSSEGSTAHISKILGSPVVLVVNGEAMALSAAALVKGFADFDRDVRVRGVILNNIYGEGHYRLLKEVIEENTYIPVLGYLSRKSEIALPDRHLGLVTSAEVSDLKEKAGILSREAQKTIDLGKLLELSGEAAEINEDGISEVYKLVGIKNKEAETIDKNTAGVIKSEAESSVTKPEDKKVLEVELQDTKAAGIKAADTKAPCRARLAVAMDKAFCFYYRDNLDLLEMLGMELVYFSPLTDSRLPEDIDGLYVGGGYPELWAGELQGNLPMRKDIKNRIEAGLPAYAECGGLMYMTESITDKDGKEYDMAGLISGKSHMTDSLNRFGYVFVKLTQDTILGKKGAEIRAHEFHFSEAEIDESIKTCYEVSGSRDSSTDGLWSCGFSRDNLLAGYAHMHFWSNPEFARSFAESCLEYRMKKGDLV